MRDELNSEMALWETRSSRRQLLVAGGEALVATSGLLMPAWLDAEGRQGATNGALGGRHGENRRGRDKTMLRKRGDRVGDGKERLNAPGTAFGVKDVKLTFFNDTSLPKLYQFWYRGDPAFASGWELEFAPGELPAGGQLPCQSHITTVKREGDDRDSKNFSVRLRQTW